MTALRKPKRLTEAEYFAIELRSEAKHEFFDGEMFLMAGANWTHNVITRNLTGELHARLKNGPCQVVAADLRLKVSPTGLYTYPDLMIVCGQPEFAAENPHTLTNPTTIIEVLSESTERYDRTTKLRHYKQLPSLVEYFLVAQDEPLVERFTRQADGAWVHTSVVGLDEVMLLSRVPDGVPMADVYRGVEFPPPPSTPAE